MARRLYDMAAQTSPDAHIPVFFALMKLETMHLLRDILFFNVSLSQIGFSETLKTPRNWGQSGEDYQGSFFFDKENAESCT